MHHIHIHVLLQSVLMIHQNQLTTKNLFVVNEIRYLQIGHLLSGIAFMFVLFGAESI